jgi:hypothetical protein
MVTLFFFAADINAHPCADHGAAPPLPLRLPGRVAWCVDSDTYDVVNARSEQAAVWGHPPHGYVAPYGHTFAT